MGVKVTNTESMPVEGLAQGREIQNLSKDVIAHLSKEIETSTTNIMAYRSKIAFAVFLGPFLLLLAVVANTKGLSISLNLGWVTTVVIGTIWCLCFLTLALLSVRIELQAWRQCNKWRQIIAQLHNDPSARIKTEDLCDDLYNRVKKTQIVYVFAYAVLLTSFLLSLIVIAKLRLPGTLPNSSQTNVTISTQQGR